MLRFRLPPHLLPFAGLIPLAALFSAGGCASTEPEASGVARPSSKGGESSLVAQQPDGALSYRPYTAAGDILPDFSSCGYGGGGVPLPEIPVRETLAPLAGQGDDAPRIQAALDRVAALAPDASGFRGAVLLERGQYRCGDTLRIAASGIVLRGEGPGPDGTVLRATYRRARPLVELSGKGAPQRSESQVAITSEVVPVGARSFQVAGAEGLSVGQTVYVRREGNQAWISTIGMDRIEPRRDNPESTRQWKPFSLDFDRVITAIDGDRVTVDAPVMCAIERRWGGGAVIPYKDANRIEHCGVENLRAVSDFNPALTERYRDSTVQVDEDHATYFVSFGTVKNAWARDLTVVHFSHGPVRIGDHAKWITVQDCRGLEPISRITGGRRYPYSIDGQLVLIQRCLAAKARHAFVFGSAVPGPNVFLQCRSENDFASSEPHHRWSVGGLYDNVEAGIAIQDRGAMGSGHGWAGANYVVWNCRGELVCQKPPTAQNFAIGFVGRKKPGSLPRDDGWWESHNTPVKPQSLYLAQLEERRKTGR